MKRVLALTGTAVVCGLASTAFAQSPNPRWPPVTAYVEFMGNTGTFCCSLNLEWMVNRNVSVRAGWGTDVLSDDDNRVSAPVFMIYRHIGESDDGLELGGGVLRSNAGANFVAGDESRVAPTISIGWRTRINGRPLRFAFTPILSPLAGRIREGRRFLPSFGVSYHLF